ncbi:hypothetical protein B0T24DRAFT_238086 [Lasiosphaeria ovina]|uniref:Uncharacterized protein n=1 Tax=Lasiosphaeria ovina TaxID=92902 RepID=A0AAE0KII1_9PEZI|nr:hypothetical protein B0T24DRAFT_238086 [Lasiosphaeria ovina]
MASPSHGRFHDKLAHVVRLHGDDGSLPRIRSALKWLSVAERPVRTRELWTALLIDQSEDLEHIERLLTTRGHGDDQSVVPLLQDLMGPLISTTRNAPHAATFITLYDPDLAAFLHRLHEHNTPGAIRSLSFSAAEAHTYVATLCMTVCSVTSLQLAHVHDDTTPASLVLYAWAHWSTHLSLSRHSLASGDAARLTDSMIYRVCSDVLVFLLALNDFYTGPITFAAAQDRTRCAALVKQTQDALDTPIALLSALVQQQQACGMALQSARDAVEASAHQSYSRTNHRTWSRLHVDRDPLAGEGGNSPDPRMLSKVETLRIDGLLTDTKHLFSQDARKIICGFAELARGLRLLSTLVTQAPVYEELLKEYGIACSALDVLVNAANWMEAVASYPYWAEIPKAGSYDPLDITRTRDPNYEAAALIMSRLRRDAPTSARRESSPMVLQMDAAAAAAAARAGLGVCPMRWNAACLIGKLQSLHTRSATFTLNDIRLINQRTSSFSTFPPRMGGPADLPYPLQLAIPRSLRRFYGRRVGALYKWAARSDMFKSVDDFSSGTFTGGMSERWPQLKAALLAGGYRAAFAHFAIAIVLHHIRGILVPWLGTYMWYTPLEDLRLALSSPAVFLDQALAFRWRWLLFSYAQKYACDVLGGVAMTLLLAADGEDDGRVSHRHRGYDYSYSYSYSYNHYSPPRPSSTRSNNNNNNTWRSRLAGASKVGYLCWVLVTLDYMFARAVSTFAFLAAYYRLVVAGGAAEHVALGAVLKAHWTRLPPTAWQLAHYVRHGLWPLAWSAMLCAVLGQPGLLVVVLVVVGSVAAVIRFRSTVYIALEVSGMFVVGGLLGVTVVLLAAEFVRDPLGLEASTAVARRRGHRARALLLPGAAARTKMLRREAVSAGGARGRAAGRGRDEAAREKRD